MSTRSITHIHEAVTGEEKIVCSFYRHCNGEPEEHGKDLAEWLAGKRLVNGIDIDFIEGRDFNQAGTMAVSLMAHIQSISSIKVIPTGTRGCGEAYTYNVYFRGDKFVIKTTATYKEKAQ